MDAVLDNTVKRTDILFKFLQFWYSLHSFPLAFLYYTNVTTPAWAKEFHGARVKHSDSLDHMPDLLNQILLEPLFLTLSPLGTVETH